jgi:hypothetical protein
MPQPGPLRILGCRVVARPPRVPFPCRQLRVRVRHAGSPPRVLPADLGPLALKLIPLPATKLVKCDVDTRFKVPIVLGSDEKTHTRKHTISGWNYHGGTDKAERLRKASMQGWGAHHFSHPSYKLLAADTQTRQHTFVLRNTINCSDIKENGGRSSGVSHNIAYTNIMIPMKLQNILMDV